MPYGETDTVRNIPGVGEVAQTALERLGIRTIGDLLRWYPRQYLDASRPSLLSDLATGELSAIRVTIKSIHQRRSTGRGVNMVEATAVDVTGSIVLRWFNQPFLEKKLTLGSEWVFIGVAEVFQKSLSMLSPIIEEEPRILSIYAQTRGVTSKMLRGFVDWSLRHVETIPDAIPEEIRQDNNLVTQTELLQQIHQPAVIDQTEVARRQIAFEEVFWFFVQMAQGKQQQSAEAGVAIRSDVAHLQAMVSSLPFQLTDGQKRAVWDILQEMQEGHPMTRLLNGDVGSGKTVVAGLVAAMVAHAGWQSVLLVPTEILTRQHSLSLAKLFKDSGLQVRLWTAAQKDDLAGVDLIIGTHAVLQEAFSLPRLAFVIIDEQHRFGVRQRQLLRSQQEQPPHVLSMTATPIPRTLALTLYGNLSLSILREKPKDRLPIITELITPKQRASMHGRIVTELTKGNQVFVVCPLIEEKKSKASAEEGPVLQLFDTEELSGNDKKTVLAEVERLRTEHPEYGRIEAVHGKMKAEEKRSIMDQMAKGEINVLVATSVIEVGVDIPGATVIVIEGAERFGLAQLHQFRGRVGRSGQQSYCFLIPELTSATIRQRLEVLVKSDSGFEVAEQDLALRGPGELVGQAQSGLPDFRMASLTDISFLQEIKEIVQVYMTKNPGFGERYAGPDYSSVRVSTE